MGLANEPGHEKRAHQAGGQGAETGARHTDAHTVDEHGVETDVDDIHEEGGEHGDLAVAHGTEQGGPGVVDGEEGIRDGGEKKVGHGGGHHVVIQRSEDQPQNGFTKKKADGHHSSGESRNGIKKLLGGSAGIGLIPGPQVLRGHHRAAGGQGGENIDEQDADVVH